MRRSLAMLREIYAALDVPADVVEAEEPLIVVHMRGENGPFGLRSGRSLLSYYAARSNANIN